MPHFTDQAGRSITISSPPKRIISLVPSQTELLFDLGLDDAVAGITKFCVHPDLWFRTKPRIGGTKNPDLELIQKIQPDLIIGNKEENRKEDIDVLAKSFPVWVSDVNKLDEALEMIANISSITGTSIRGQKILNEILHEFEELRKGIMPFPRAIKVAYLIWQKPYIAVGSETFIHSMISECGFQNVFAGHTRYPQVSIEEIRETNCDYIFLSSEPYPFKQSHILKLQVLIPHSKCILTDGELFSWYGSRLVKAPAYFRTLINKLQDATAAN